MILCRLHDTIAAAKRIEHRRNRDISKKVYQNLRKNDVSAIASTQFCPKASRMKKG
jgi:hypothetical protein